MRSPAVLYLVISALATTLCAADSSSFVYTVGGPVPDPDHYTITNSLGAVPVTAKAGAAWLQVSLSSSVTPSTLTIAVQPAGLAPGSYLSNVTVSSNTAVLAIPLSLTVLQSVTATVFVSSSALSFTAVAGST